MKRKLLTVLVALLIIVTASVVYFIYHKNIDDSISTVSGSRTVRSYSSGNAGFECTKPIKVKKVKTRVGHLAGGFSEEYIDVPVDQAEAEKYCKIRWEE